MSTMPNGSCSPRPSGETRTIFLVDLDCFFASVERVLNPALASRPVIVGGPDARGVVCSASREARDQGVHSGMPTAIARRLCPDATFLPGRGRLYARAASAAQRVFREFAPLVERASIDEAYLDATDTSRGDALGLAAAIQRALTDRLGLPSSIGIGSNKMVAKVACRRAKPEGLLEIWPGYEAAFLAPLPIADLPGVGPVMAERLRLFGLTTIGELARVDARVLEAAFGAWGRQLAAASRGGGRDTLEQDETPRTLGAERTFPRDLDSPARMVAELYELGEVVAERLRRAGLRARTITLKVRTSDFRTITRSRTLRVPTGFASELSGTACFLLREAHQGRAVRLLGISAGALTDEPVQPSLLSDPEPAPPEPPAREDAAGLRAAPALAPALTPTMPAAAAPPKGSRRPGLLIRWHAGQPGGRAD